MKTMKKFSFWFLAALAMLAVSCDDKNDGGDNGGGDNGNGTDPNNPDGNGPDGNNPDGNNPDGNNPDGSKSNTPKTGDTRLIWLVIALAVIFVATFAATYYNRRKSKHHGA